MNTMTPNDIKNQIHKLKEEKNAVILTHNYQLGEVQDIADFVGDSLELSMKAASTDASVILFCGVSFMAETAYILSPDKIVLLPTIESGCPMADMANANELLKMKKEHPDALVVTYVNSSAEVKALSDVCVTSANAKKIVEQLPEDKEIIFVPDQNLGAYVQRETKRKMILWPGFCPTHMRITPEDILKRKEEFPDAAIIVHPESRLDVIDLADQALSTGGMLKFVKETDKQQIIVATENGMIYRLAKENPTKQFIPVSEQAVCPTMKLHRIEDVLNSLKNMTNQITIPENIREQAFKPINKMLEMS